jgi:hypothetical protein
MLAAARFLLRSRNSSTNWLEKMVASGAGGGILALFWRSQCALQCVHRSIRPVQAASTIALALRRMVVERVALPSQRRFVGSKQ